MPLLQMHEVTEVLMHTTTAQPACAERIQTPVQMPPDALNVVIVDHELPYPPTNRKRAWTLNLVQRLARRHRITIICTSTLDNTQTQRARALLLGRGVRTVIVPSSPFDRVASIFWPQSVVGGPGSIRRLRRALRDYAEQHPVDLWHCQGIRCAAALGDFATAPRVVLALEIGALSYQREQEQEPSALKRWLLHGRLRRAMLQEQTTFAAATATITACRDDADLAHFALGAPRVEVVDHGVDLECFRPGELSRQPETVLFLGSLDQQANLDAVQQLLSTIWPAVAAARVAAKLLVVGSNPPRWLSRRIASVQGAELHGNAPDVRLYLNQCSLLAVPIRKGTGSRLRILEALASETPVISTAIGAEGLRLLSGEHLTVVDGIPSMATAILTTLSQPQLAQEQAARGRQAVADSYSWDRSANRLEQVWLSCVPCRRQAVGG
jgi:glycosyltransferase involved in cell wall biosynthesis